MVMPPLDQPVTLEFLSPLQAIGEEAGPAIGAFLKANSGTGAPLGVLDPDPIAAAQKLMALTEQVVKHFVPTIWYLKQASALMTTQDQLREFPGGTDSGPGRIDDFRLARNVIVGNLLMGKPPTSPTSYPDALGQQPREVAGLGRQRQFHHAAEHRHGAGRRRGVRPRVGDVVDPAGGRLSPRGDRLEGRAAEVAVRGDQRGEGRRGAKIYQHLCAKCHVDPDAVPLSPAGTLPDWLPDLLYDLRPPDAEAAPKGPPTDKVVGTDPNRAVNFAQDMVTPPGIPNPVESLAILQKVLYVGDNVSPWQAKRLLGDRDETWRATGKYAGRPLTAVWAAAPYLHNDSVPTLWDLLQPAREAAGRFPPRRAPLRSGFVGYREPGPGEPGFLFDTRQPGNRNIGHEYGTDLSIVERIELLEYLKTK